MRICMVLDKPFPPDPRVEEEARCLIAAGHEVHLLCPDLGDPPAPSPVPDLHVQRRPMRRPFHRRAGALCLTVPLYDRWFRRHLQPYVAAQRIEALHIHDLRIAREGPWAARRFGIPWVLDLHENYPASLQHYPHAGTLLGRVLIWPSAWARFEARMVRAAGGVIVVTREASEELISRCAVGPEKVTILPNVAPRDFLQRAEVAFPEDRFRLVYIGDTGRRRGTDLCVRAVAALRESLPDLELVMAGTSSYQGALEDLVSELDLGDRVRLLGWRPPQELPGLIEDAHAGLAPFRRSRHHDTTYANKLFQCMALGRPVIASDCIAQERVITEERCGLIFRSGDVDALAECIVALHADRERLARMGARGRAAVRERYNWDITGRALVRLYANLRK